MSLLPSTPDVTMQSANGSNGATSRTSTDRNADDYKYRFIDQPAGWLGEKTHPGVPYITNLRLDPFERTGWPNNGTKEGGQQYFDWF
jgi:hypothetical protein